MPWDFWLIFFVLAVLLPWRGRARLKKLLEVPRITSQERLLLYTSTILFQWVAAAVVAWRAWARGLTPELLGLLVHGAARVCLAAIVGATALGAFQWFNLRRLGHGARRASSYMQPIAERILPQSPKELSVYLLLTLTAGVCEEFLYRGFAMAALLRVGLPAWSVVLLSSVLFGLAHLYQGRGGFLSTLVIGTVFGSARIAYDGFAAVAVWHVAVDAVAGIAGPRYVLRPLPSAKKDEIPGLTES
ncbi:MAG TPA: CPBP family intramembrane glutamic endopeptidase [Candidatus Acidoferrum sp.]|nr:CPBP family intramembrane glutamic endopeptidase [Candidatus Acidoferrum sp.]